MRAVEVVMMLLELPPLRLENNNQVLIPWLVIILFRAVTPSFLVFQMSASNSKLDVDIIYKYDDNILDSQIMYPKV